MVGLCRFISCFLLFATIGHVTSYQEYVVAEVGQNASISLHINSAHTRQFYVTHKTLTLFKQNLQLLANNVATRITDLKRHPNGTISFILKNVTLQDAGIIRLRVKMNTVDMNILVVAARPEIESITTTPAVVGKSMTMTCNARSRTQPPYHPLTMSYIWQKNGQPLLSDDHMTASNLIIPNVSPEHQGDTYRCQACETQGYNSYWSGETTLYVQLAPTRIRSPIELHECGGSECWEFRILAFPKPTLEKIILFRPNKSSIQLYVKPSHTELKENFHKYTMEFRGPDYRGQYVFQFRNDVGVRNLTFDLFEDTPHNFVIYVAVTCSFIVIIITVSATVYCIRTYSKNTEATVTEKINDSDISHGYLTAVHETRTEDNVASDGEACSHGTVMSPRNAGCGISQPLLPAPAPPPRDLDYDSRPPLPPPFKLQQVKHADSCAWCS